MTTLGEKIQKARESLPGSLTQSDFAGMFAVSRVVVANWENGRTLPDESVVRKLAVVAGIPVSWFYDGMDSPIPLSQSSVVATGETIKDLILVDDWGEVPCGDWDMPTSDASKIHVSGSLRSASKDPNFADLKCVRVSGNSMLPLFRHGQKVVIKLTKDAVDGLIYLVRNGDQEFTLKVLRGRPGHWQLHPLNPDHEPPHAVESWEIVGKVIHTEQTDLSGFMA